MVQPSARDGRSSAPLFAFRLRDVDAIEPWVTQGRKKLHWFGLTDGWYWMNVGDERLFTSLSPAGVVEAVDYQVVRLWEDLLELLPNALAPLPAELGDRLRPDREWVTYVQRAAAWAEKHGVLDRIEDALDFGWARKLSTMHLASGPDIWIWRTGDAVQVGWDNRQRQSRGAPAWLGGAGHVELPVAAFLDEVRDFDLRLLAAMEERVAAAETSWSRSDVSLDLVALRKEQVARSTWLGAALSRPPGQPRMDPSLAARMLAELDGRLASPA